MKTLLYVEEYENSFVNELLKIDNLRLVLLRFKQNMSFSEMHLIKTQCCAVFVLDKKNDINYEAERFVDFLSKNDLVIDYFYNDSEYNQELVQAFARRLKLEGALSERQAKLVRDKLHMKQFIEQIGYKCMPYILLKSKEDARKFVQEVGYPFIIKWRQSVSSIEVYKIENEDNLEKLKIDYSSEQYISEEYCPWKIWCIDSIVSKGIVVTNLYTWLPFTNLDFAEKKKRFAQIACGKHPDNWTFSPYKLTSDIISGLELKSGFLHLEVFIDNQGKPIICEFAWRTPGEHMLSNYSLVYGVSIPMLLYNAIMEEPIIPIKENDNVVSDVFLPTSTGEIAFITSIKELSEVVEILDGEIYFNVGEKIKSKRKYTDCSGWVQISSKKISDIIEKIEKIYGKFVIEVI